MSNAAAQFFNPSPRDSAPIETFVGNPQRNDRLGTALASGDFDGDGYSDLAAGAPGEYVGTIPHGAVNVVHGGLNGLNPSRQQVWNLETLAVSDDERTVDMGYTLASGDFNGDGYDDLALSGRGVNPFGPKGGAVYVVYGSPNGLDRESGSQVWHMDRSDLCYDPPGIAGCAASELDDYFGGALAAGDFNNDGFDELAVGIRGVDSDPVVDVGAVLVLQGSAEGLSADGHRFFTQDDPADIIDSAEAGDWFGAGLAVGDINGDGFEDLAIGSTHEDLDEYVADDAGSVNLLYGSDSGLSAFANQFLIAQSSEPDAEAGDNFGTSIVFGYFSNGLSANPRRADLVVGMPGRRGTSNMPGFGAINHFLGTEAGATPANTVFIGPETDGLGGFATPDGFFGAALASGDFDGDGFEDLSVGQPGEAGGKGAFHVLRGAADEFGIAANRYWTQDSLNAYPPSICTENQCFGRPLGEMEEFGGSFAAGDFNMDGYVDLAIGAPGRFRYIENPDRQTDPSLSPDVNISGAGSVNVMYGSASGLTLEGARMWFQNLPPNPTQPVTPSDNSEVTIGGIESPGSAETPLVVAWDVAEDPDSTAVTYSWQISRTEAFDDTLASFDAGSDNQILLPHGDLAAVMSAQNVGFDQSVTWFHRVVTHDLVEGTSGPALSLTLTRGTFVDTEPAGELPAEATILSAFPNPATHSATLRYRTTESGGVTLILYDIRGAVVQTSRRVQASPGEHSIDLDLGALPAGVYVFTMSGGGLNDSGKLIVMP